MFIGHYAAAFAARAVKPAVPLWLLFVAVQLVDFAWAAFIIAGVEHVRIEPGLMAASNLDLYHMPWTHSLVAAIVWSIAAGAVYMVIRRGGSALMAGIIVAAAVFSHWLADLIVHAPDLAIYPGGPKVGFSLWNSLLWSQVLEVGLLLVGFAIYMAKTTAGTAVGRFGPWALIVFMLAVQAYSHMPIETAPPIQQFAITALVGYSVLSLLAWLVDRKRAAA